MVKDVIDINNANRHELKYMELYPITHSDIGCSIHDNLIECVLIDARLIKAIATHEPGWSLQISVREHAGETFLQKTLILPSSSHVTMFLFKYYRIFKEWNHWSYDVRNEYVKNLCNNC